MYSNELLYHGLSLLVFREIFGAWRLPVALVSKTITTGGGECPSVASGVTQLNCGSTRPSVSDYGDQMAQTRQVSEGRIRLQRVLSSACAIIQRLLQAKIPAQTHENLLRLFNLQILKEKQFGHGLLCIYSFRQRYTDLLIRHVNETKGNELNYRRFRVECSLNRGGCRKSLKMLIFWIKQENEIKKLKNSSI